MAVEMLYPVPVQAALLVVPPPRAQAPITARSLGGSEA